MQSRQVQVNDFRLARRIEESTKPPASLPEIVYQNVPEEPAPAIVASEPPPVIPEAAPEPVRPVLQLSRRPVANIVSARGKSVVVEKIGRRRSKPSLTDLVAAASAQIVQEAAPVPAAPVEPPRAHVLAPDPSIAHLFDRSMDAKPLRARPGAELVPPPEPVVEVAPVKDTTGGSKRITARAPVERKPRAPKVDRSEMYGPFRPRGNPKWYAMKAERMAAAQAPAVEVKPEPVVEVAPVERKPRKVKMAVVECAPVAVDTTVEVKRIRNRLAAQQKAQAKMARLMQFASGNW